MGRGVTEPFYVLDGQAKDIETIIRLRPWMEDEVRMEHGFFNKTGLITDYDKAKETFDFKIEFFR